MRGIQMLGRCSMRNIEINWKEPWRAIQFSAEIPGVQNQVNLEISAKHPLFGKEPKSIGRHIDDDDVLVVHNDGTYVNVHLVWGKGIGAFPAEYPTWFAYGSVESFISAMNEDATQYEA